MIDLRRFLPSDRQAVLNLSVTQSQAAFVESLAWTLSDDAPLYDNAPRRDNFVIDAGGVVVGFFQIDSSSDKQQVPGCLELHEIMIGAQHQGQGYGKDFAVALKEFLQREYPAWNGVCLTVNCRNDGAYRLYQLGGFVDTGRLCREGRSGPQFIMRLGLS